MKVGILGAGGCFAQNFANYLGQFGIDRFGIARSEKIRPFWQITKPYRFSVVHLVDDPGLILDILDGERPDVIVNFAAQGEGAASFGANCYDFYRTNVLGLIRISEYLRQYSPYLKRFIQIGSSEVYGSNDAPVSEYAPIKASSPYALSKACFDEHLQIMHRIHGFPINIIRPSNCYTPGQQLYRIIPKAIICALSGKKLPLHGGGKARKSYLHATDLSDAIHRVILLGRPGEVYNVGPRQPISIRELVAHVAEACGVKYGDLVEEVPDRVGQDGCYWLDSGKLFSETNWTPLTSLETGIAEMVKWVKAWPELQSMPTDYVHRP
jgi:dTDP-glucose 4,6-dehydratase